MDLGRYSGLQIAYAIVGAMSSQYTYKNVQDIKRVLYIFIELSIKIGFLTLQFICISSV